MRATRSNLPYLIAAAGGVVLFISLFLSWVSVGGASASAWDFFSILDVLLALLALATIATAGAEAAGAELPVPGLRPEVLKWVGVISLTIVLTYVLEGDNLGFGAFLAVVAATAMLAGGILAERPDLAGRLADATGVPQDTRPAASPPAGSGGSASSVAPPRPAAPRPTAPSQPSSPVTQPATSESPTAVQPAAGSGAGGVPAGAEPAAAAQPAQSSGPPAGWYPDPQGQARLRYWDGNAWTDQTSG